MSSEIEGYRLVEREGQRRLAAGVFDVPLLAAVVAHGFHQWKSDPLKGLQVPANRFLADPRFLGHFADGGPVAAGAEHPQQNPLPDKWRFVGHRCPTPSN